MNSTAAELGEEFERSPNIFLSTQKNMVLDYDHFAKQSEKPFQVPAGYIEDLNIVQ